MRTLLLLPALLVLGVPAHADVVRCTDASGAVSYTDKACPAGSKQTGSVAVPEAAAPSAQADTGAAQEQMDSVNRARQLQRETVESSVRQPPAGATVIDSRGGPPGGAASQPPTGSSGIVAETWYPDGVGGGYYRRPAPVQDMRPTMRNCGPNGCTDTLGNHYNRQGQIDRYQRDDGKTCRQVNSTQICR